MKKFKIMYYDTSGTGWAGYPDDDYGIVEADTPEEAAKIVAEKVVTDGIVSLHGINYREIFAKQLTVTEVQ
jgi:hypothetical protein